MAFIDTELSLIHAIHLNRQAIAYLKSNYPNNKKRDKRIKAHKILIKKYKLALKELSL